MKKLLVLTVAVMMVPLFMGVLCPCAMGASPEQPVFQKARCQGCCPEMDASPECRHAIQVQTSSSLNEPFKVSNVLKALSLGASPDIAINRRALVPAGDGPLALSPQPLYQTLQVLRI